MSDRAETSHCCTLECGAPAVWRVRFSPQLEDYTECCDPHLHATLAEGNPLRTLILRIDAPLMDGVDFGAARRTRHGDNSMSDKAETVTCGTCDGTGHYDFDGMARECGDCSGTGVRTTGEVVGVLPSTPDPVTDEPLPSQVPTITVTHNQRADHFDLALQAHVIADLTKERDEARLAYRIAFEQSENLEREHAARALERDEARAEVERLKRALAIDESGYKGEIATLKVEREKARADVRRLKNDEIGLLADNARLTTDRDQLRLEVQKLKDDRHEAADVYAAIEAERDELRENLGLSLRHSGEMASKLAALTAERDEARAEVERLKIRCQQQRRDCVEFAGELRVAEEDERKAAEQVNTLVVAVNEQRARAESYLRVIGAQSDMIELQERHNVVALRLSQAYTSAGFATDVLQVADVPRVKEGDRE